MASATDTESGARPANCWNYAGSHVAALLDDCNRMLGYATDKGIGVASEDSMNVSVAGKAFARGQWSEEIESRLYTTKSKLAAAIRPVTTETLDACALHDARKSTRFYFKATLAIAAILVPLSMVVFANAKLTSSSKALIEQNDKMALSLYNELEDHRAKIVIERKQLIAAAENASGAMVASSAPVAPMQPAHILKTGTDAGHPRGVACGAGPGGVNCVALQNDPARAGLDADRRVADTPSALVIKEQLQEFARNNRSLYAQTRWLSVLNFAQFQNVYASPWMINAATLRENLELRLPILTNPYRSTKLDIPPGDDANNPEHAIDDGLQKLAVYQDIRAMAQDAQRTSDIVWAAITTYILPVLYAVLGSLAFILRDLSEQSISKTYHPTHGRFINRVRLVIAVIIGTVIGLFDTLWKDSVVSASPLAIAFVAGYAANTFFAFIDKSSLAGKTVAKHG